MPVPQRTWTLGQSSGSLHTALEGAEEMYGEAHPITGGILQALSEVCTVQGDVENGGRYRERAEANRRANLELEYMDVADTLTAHGTALMGHGLYEEAHAYLERALSIREDTLGEQDFDTSMSLLKLGILSQLRHLDNEARPYLERALVVRSALYGEGHAATELVRDNLRLLDS